MFRGVSISACLGTLSLLLLTLPAIPSWATTFTVTNNGDSGPGTLRDAITQANASPGPHTIRFSIVAPAFPTDIILQSPLPAITQSTTFDGYSQSVPGFPGHFIDVNGFFVQGSMGLDIEAPDSVVQGLIFEDWRYAADGTPSYPIHVGSAATNTTISGNWVGVGVNGTDYHGGCLHDVWVDHASGAQILDNVLAFCDYEGVNLDGASNSLVQGNFIGIEANGLSPAPNYGSVAATGSNNVIAFNVMCATNNGIEIQGSGDQIRGNWIGKTSLGVCGVGQYGIALFSSSDVTIGGLQAGDANEIAGAQLGIFNVQDSPSITIYGNSMFQNGGGIENGQLGIHPGPFSIDTTSVPGEIVISGTGTPNSSYFIQVFSDPVVYGSLGQGQALLGNFILPTDANGFGSTTLGVGGVFARGTILTLTSTDVDGSTSMFSADVQVPAANFSVSETVADAGPVLDGTSDTFTIGVRNAGPTAGPLSLHNLVPSAFVVASVEASQGTPTMVTGTAGTAIDVDFGSIAVDGTANVIVDVTIAPGAIGSASNTATVSSPVDPGGASHSASVVVAFRQPPVAFGQTTITQEDTSVAVDAVASDPAGAPLSFTLVTPPAHGTLTGSLPSVTYTPSLHYRGMDSFSFTATDGVGTTSVTTETIVVQAVNHAPVAVADFYSSTEDTPLTVDAAHGVLSNDTDIDPQSALRALPNTPPSHGTLTLSSSGAFTYAPAPNYNGADSFDYVAWDGTSISAPAIVSLSIGAAADQPAAPSSSSPAAGDVLVTGPVTFAWQAVTDPDGGTPSYHVTVSRTGHPDLTADTSQTTATMTLAAGTYAWKVSASTPSGTSPDSAAVSFEVKSVAGSHGGCSCELAAGEPRGLLGLLLAAAAIIAARARRRIHAQRW